MNEQRRDNLVDDLRMSKGRAYESQSIRQAHEAGMGWREIGRIISRSPWRVRAIARTRPHPGR